LTPCFSNKKEICEVLHKTSDYILKALVYNHFVGSHGA